MARLDENQMSQRIVDFCNDNKTFKKNFIELFTDPDDVDSIEFTGYEETGFGKPDITIKFKKGRVYYIEVKTREKTGFQENQISDTTGYGALIKKNKQQIDESLGYLLDDNHDKSKCLIKDKNKVISWNTILKIVEDFNNPELAKDIKCSVDGIPDDEKIFGPDEEMFSNPYQLALFNDIFAFVEEGKYASSNWIFNDIVKNALDELGCKGIGCKTYNNCSYVSFNIEKIFTEKREIHMNYERVWIWKERSTNENFIGSFFFNSFTFYRPWIVGVRFSRNTKEFIRYTKKAIKLWLYDLKNIVKVDCGGYQTFNIKGKDKIDSKDSELFAGRADTYGNPFVLSNCIGFLRNDPDKIYDNYVVPALKKIKKNISNPNICNIAKENREETKGIKFQYKEISIEFDLSGFWSSKIDEWKDYNSFTFYRPWIVGVHKAKDEDQLIQFTKEAIELWIYDLEEEGFI